MTEEQWHAIVAFVQQEMARYTRPFATPISAAESEAVGGLVGTGTYFKLRDAIYVLTNHHVLEQAAPHPAAHLVGVDNHYALLSEPVACSKYLDACILRVRDAAWALGGSEAIGVSQIAERFEADPAELLYVSGFPGARSYYSPSAEMLVTHGVPYATQQGPIPDGLDPRVFFSLLYSSEHAIAIDPKERRYLPDAHGYSGSIVWNTRFVATADPDSWTATQARVCGLLITWKTNLRSLIGIRIEHLRPLFLEGLRREAAYYHWLERDRVVGDPLTDWAWAESSVPSVE
jgi:hypothetical protein